MLNAKRGGVTNSLKNTDLDKSQSNFAFNSRSYSKSNSRLNLKFNSYSILYYIRGNPFSISILDLVQYFIPWSIPDHIQFQTVRNLKSYSNRTTNLIFIPDHTQNPFLYSVADHIHEHISRSLYTNSHSIQDHFHHNFKSLFLIE